MKKKANMKENLKETATTFDCAAETELERFFQDNPDVDTVDALFPDMCGIMRGKRLTRGHARQLFSAGLQIPGSMLLLSASGTCMDPMGYGVSDGDPDVLIRPVAGSLCVIPWAVKPRGQVMVRFFDEDGDQPHPFEPRQLLQQVVARFAELGLTPVVACELEFCLIDRDADANGSPRPPESPVAGRRHSSTQLMSLSYVDDFGDYVAAVTSACRQLAVPVTAVNAEYGGDQFEINLHHVDDAVMSADQAVMLKQIIQGVAASHDMRATFMAKPYPQTAGSGMHWHVSLLDADGRNVFDDGSGAGSEILRHAVAGVLQTMPEAMALFAPNINSYRRFKPGLFVPMSRSWGYNNRSVALRVPAGATQDRRLEYRLPGADANPYLALAALLAGMHQGISAKLPAPAPSDGNVGDSVNGSVNDGLPLRLYDALRELDAAQVLPNYLGAEYCGVYAECKRLELDAFLDTVSDREFSWYLRPDA